MKKDVHVISNTHWDYEWYFTNHETFVQFAYHMDEVLEALEENIIKYYMLDGQMSILDQYLEAFPENKNRIKKLVQDGRLQIGPWYTQTDELIISGESIIRNLDLGIRTAEKLGGYMNIGYLPDSFGQGKDMPKIYNGFGIEHAVFWRGVPETVTEEREFKWKSEDDSSVIVSNIKDGYYVGVGLIGEENYEQLMDQIEAGATQNSLTLSVGGDQRYIDYDLRERIEIYNQNLENYHLFESTYEKYFESLNTKYLNTVQGEFISPSVSKIHRSIYSSRYDHKYLNDKVERRMIYQVEPLMVMAEQLGINYKKGLVDKIWKTITMSHAHDSAGGCNSDKTNRIILDRLIEADQLSYSTIDYLTRKISESVENSTNDLFLFNPLPWQEEKNVEIEFSTKFKKFTIYKDKEKLEYDLIATKKENSDSVRRDESLMDKNQFYYVHTIKLPISLSPFSITKLHVMESTEANHVEEYSNQVIENDFYKIELIDNQLCLTDKKQNKIINNFLYFENGGDEGDTYDYSPAYKDDIYNLFFDHARVTNTQGKSFESLRLSGKWNIARDLNSRAEQKRDCSINYEFLIELTKNNPTITFDLKVDNQAKDHRLRAIIDSDTYGDFSYADTPFGYTERDFVDKHLKDWKERGWREEPTSIYPMLNYVNIHDKNKSVTAFAKGIKEYQIIGDNFKKIALTLFRSVGYLGRPDLIRRPGVASGNEFKYIETPDSQLNQKLTNKFAINVAESFNPAELKYEFLNYAQSIPYYQIQDLNQFTTTLKYFVSNEAELVKKEPNLVNLNSENLVFSSLRKGNQHAGFEIRVYNPHLTEEVEGGFLEFDQEINYEFVNFKGIPESDRYKSAKVQLNKFKPGEIKTLHIQY